MRSFSRLFAVVVLALAAQATGTWAGSPTVAVDAAVVLAADVSRSIDEGEFVLERRGYADAIQSSKLIDAVSTGPPWGSWRSPMSNGRAPTSRSSWSAGP